MERFWGLRPEEWAALNAMAAVASAVFGLLAALATVWAVRVALRLSRFEVTPHLIVQSSVRAVIDNETRKKESEVFTLSATNLGIAPARLTYVMYRCGRLFRKRKFITNSFYPRQGKEALPKTIAHGESVVLDWDIDTWSTTLAEHLLQDSKWSESLIKSMKVGFATSVGCETYDALRDDLKASLRGALEKLRKKV